IYTSHLYEVQKYVMETRHLISFYLFSVGERFEQKFAPEHRRAILEALREATTYHNDLVMKYEAEYREKLSAAGMTFVPVERAAFEKKAFEKLPLEFGRRWDKELYESLLISPKN
ncbi:MAG: hypothetical protein D6714_01300, partial [Bacteroidetes bacterium]